MTSPEHFKTGTGPGIGPDIRPVPDPTDLTRASVQQAVNASREYTDGRAAVLTERINGIDRATELRLSGIEGIPGQIEEKVGHLSELTQEQFRSVATQFQERDIRTQKQEDAAAQALAAALQAAKELVGAQGEASAAAAVKSETSFTKQIDQIGTIIQTLEKALDARITELKERIDRGEGTSTGQSQQRVATSATANIAIGAIGLLITIISVATAIIAVAQ